MNGATDRKNVVMNTETFYDFATLALHAGSQSDPHTGARATPIYWTSAFKFDDSDHAAALFNMEQAGHVYSRLSNPTCSALEERISALDQGVGAIATASGQAALHLAIATVCSQGSHIVASRALYGGSHNLLAYTLKRFGINTTFVDPTDLDAWRNAITPNTRLLFGETLGNPGLDVLNMPAVAQIARDASCLFLVDSTFTTPYLAKPIEFGADLVYHSATKFLCGHGTAMAGLIVDSGRFDFWKSSRYPEMTEPYEGFHGMVFAQESSVAPFLIRARREGLRDFGACLSPMNAFAILQGIETIELRMQKHVSNALSIAQFLSTQDLVANVCYPGLETHRDFLLAQHLMPKGCGAVFSLELKADRAAGRRFVEALQLFSHVANVGDAKSLVIHPASTTHFRMDSEALRASGIGEGTLRLSIGLESSSDLIDDLKRGFRALKKIGH
jgi:O-acetylhomoserine (thiol)-lyase